MRLNATLGQSRFVRALTIVRFAVSITVLLSGILFCARSFGENTLPPTGQVAPELELSRILQAPPGTQPALSSLRGKAVVLEFWATWCGGCVAAIPHLNELARHFKHKPVVFLSVTDEGAEVVQAFLSRRPIDGWVGIDKDGATFRRYGVDGRPQTILIDARGILRAPVSPERLDLTVTDQLIAGSPFKMAPT